MKPKDVADKLYASKYLDDDRIYAYGQTSSSERFLFAVAGERITVFESNFTNDAVKIIFAAPIGSLKDVQVRLGSLGLKRKISFRYNAVPYRFYTSVRAGKFNKLMTALSRRPKS